MSTLKVSAIFSPLLPLNYHVGEGHCIIIGMAHHAVVRYLMPYLSSFQAELLEQYVSSTTIEVHAFVTSVLCS